MEYLIEWKEYPHKPTWEPAANLENIKEMLDEYNDMYNKVRKWKEEKR